MAAAAMVIACVGVSGPAASGGTSSLPFNDPQADGYIGFCDLAGHNVTSGSVDSVPFVWKAVSSVEPPSSLRGPGENADMNIYQVRRGIDPGDWTGQNLIPATDYARPKLPTAATTYKDYALDVITTELPPMWDGLYALRMQFGKAGYGIYSSTYPMTVIQVAGGRWHVVSGGLVNCARAKAVPQEILTGVAKQQLPPTPSKNETPPTAAPSARATSTSTPTPAATAGSTSTGGLTKSVADPISAPVTLGQHGGGLSATLVAVLITAAVIGFGLGGLALARRRRLP